MARRRTAEALPVPHGDLPVVERTLPNGLRALILPRPRAAVVVCDLYYPVGSVDEPEGKTGLAHFVEHMLFKGTRRFPKGQLDRLTFVSAGEVNAETDEDCTHYWFRFPRDRWELALDLEADRMRGALFDPSEVESERRVIDEERARELDSPTGRLDEQFLLNCYTAHPYRNPILGWPEHLDSITVDDLKSFYDTHYRPDGAVLVLAGDLDPDAAFDAVSARFGPIRPGRGARRHPSTVEPPQREARRFELKEPDAIARGLIGWHSVARGHADSPALGVTADLLSCGRRSRLWDALVERGRLATYVDALHEPSHLAGQMMVQVEAVPGVDPRRIEAAVRKELDRLAAEGPTSEELLRSRRRLEAAWRWQQDDLPGLAGGLGVTALWGRWTDWPDEHRAALSVSADDVRRVASAYLCAEGSTVGWALPRNGRATVSLMPATAANPAPSPQLSPARTAAASSAMPTASPRSSAPTLPDYRPRSRVLDNGLRVITERHPGAGVVALELFVDADSTREAVPGAAYLTGRLLEEGTGRRSAEELAEAVEDVGAVLDAGSTGASLEIRAEDLALGIEVLADLVRRPTFPGDAVSWAKRRTVAELRGDRDDPAFRADLLFRGLVYGDHPYARDSRGTPRQLSGLTRDDVVAHHRRYFAPDNAVLVAVGDYEPRALRTLLARHFGDWRPVGRPAPPVPMPRRSSRPRTRRVDHPGEQVHLMIGHLGVERRHPDFEALAVLDHVFGSGPGFTDRLSASLRDDLGLAYSVSGGMTDSADRAAGVFRVYVGTGPDEAELAVSAVLDQIRALHRGDFGDEEVAQAVHYLRGSWVFDYQTVSQRSDRLVDLAYYGLPLDDPIRMPARLARLSPSDIRRVARRHIDPTALVRVEYGPLRGRARRRSARPECA
ncbi:M16 family metallopeptidase [Tautonia plasticadhaerens]|uniref:Protease 3 n=1 Tax=Tautonia plasticadhaerens TaxID=2527974 RepID=A0A518GWF2_9BACT|nr:pitrilysin family protein [Tautonia plasticadhaerens]QDV32922.1 Protease 3 precursor [Tautonia plasticadhaerens]